MENRRNGRITLALVKRDTEEIKKSLERLTECWQTDHDRLGKVEANQGLLAIGQSLLTLVASTIAGYVGSRR